MLRLLSQIWKITFASLASLIREFIIMCTASLEKIRCRPAALKRAQACTHAHTHTHTHESLHHTRPCSNLVSLAPATLAQPLAQQVLVVNAFLELVRTNRLDFVDVSGEVAIGLRL